MQWAPCALVKLITLLTSALYGDTINLEAYQLQNVTMLDARRHAPGSFLDSGFTLLTLDQEPAVSNWGYGSADIHLFNEAMEPYLLQLYPQTKVCRDWLIVLTLVLQKVPSEDDPKVRNHGEGPY